mgnify:CR=1 FL=1
MPIKKNELEELIKAALPDAQIELKDLAGDEDHWQATVISAKFAGKSRIEQHKMVQEAVKSRNIHALSIKTVVRES